MNEETAERLVERLIRRVEQANTYFLTEIGASIKKIRDLTPSQAQQLIQILKYGGNYESIIDEISKITKLNIKDIEDIFKKYAKNDLNFYKEFYEYRNIPFKPFDENEAIKSQTRALLNMAKEEMYNFTRDNVLGYTIYDTLPNGKRNKAQFYGLRDTYNRVLDEALLNVGQGKETFDSAMKHILEDIGGSGLKTLNYESGRAVRLDSAVRMHLNSRLRELHNENQKIIGDVIKSNGIEITVHSNPALDHQYAQGKQFTNEEFEKLQTTGKATTYDGKKINMHNKRKDGTEIDTHRPISELNCYHQYITIVLGVRKPQFTNEQLQQIIDNNNKGFNFEGKHYTNYEGTQLQRRIETEIRKQKDIQILGKTSGDKDLAENAQYKINILTQKYNELNNISGLPSKVDRLQVNGYRKINLINNNKQKPIVNAAKPVVDNKKMSLNEWQEYFGKKYGSFDIFKGVVPYDKNKTPMFKISDDIKSLNKDLMDKQFTQLDYLFEKYKIERGITINRSNTKRFIAQANSREIMYSKNWFTDDSKLINSTKISNESGWHTKVPEKNLLVYTTTHEFGHYLEHILQDKYITNHSFISYEKFDTYIRERIFDKALSYKNYKNITELKKNCLSKYGNSKRHYEWFAETFAGMELGADNDLTRAMKEILEEYYE